MRKTDPETARAPAGCFRNQRGVSLVETMVALTILAVSTATVGEFIVRQTRMATTNHLTSVAHTLVEEVLEGLRALDYDQIAGGTTSHTEGGVQFTVKTEVLANSPAPNMKRITVDVTWNDPLGPQHVQVNTIYTAIKR